ncbi:MAG: EamA family transporter [Erysipelotrichaceae bacterium]|nr:EamA family transporter [Erysipelotrichaceae bacterium]
MLNTWWFNLIIYLVFYIVFTQSYKVATKSSKNDGALTTLLQFLGGLIVLLFVPLFKIQFPDDIRTYIFLIIACIFYAIADRVNTTARRGLDVSTFSILGQLTTVFLIIWGIVFFKEEIVLKKIIGAILILIGNVMVLYKKGKFEFNKYVVFGVLGNLASSIGISVDVGISDKFNMPIYVAFTLIIPSLLILLVDKINTSDVLNELKEGNKKAILLVSSSWGIMIIGMLRAYQFGSVTTIAPIASVTTIINVFVAYFYLKEKDSLLKKVLAALIVISGIVLIQI